MDHSGDSNDSGESTRDLSSRGEESVGASLHETPVFLDRDIVGNVNRGERGLLLDMRLSGTKIPEVLPTELCPDDFFDTVSEVGSVIPLI